MERPTHVFVLSHIRPSPDGLWAGTFIGVYSSLEQAEKAQERMRTRMGYRDYPDGFRISGCRLDEDYDDPEYMGQGP